MNDRLRTGEVERIGAYRVEQVLGRGGMGEVFLAWDDRLGRHVAIKRIRPDKLADGRQRARFRREARVAARLSHPAIVQVFDILEDDGGDYIVMERVEGESLVTLLAHGPLELPLALRLAREIADGLAEAHAKGLVHRDLKPENVLLTTSGHAKILDFGLARDLAPEAGSPADALTDSGMVLGTAHAMSPEQASGQPVDPRSDLFALGALIYQLLTGDSPFRGASVADSLRRVVSVEPPPLSHRRDDVPAPLERLVTRLLSKDPATRPQSARLVVAELDRLREGLPPESRAPSGEEVSEDTETEARMAPAQPESSSGSGPVVRVLAMTDLVESTRLVGRLGDARAADVAVRHDRLARDLLARYNGQEIDKADGFLCLFEGAADAVAFGLAYHQLLDRLSSELELEVKARVGIHLGEVFLRRNTSDDVARGAKLLEVEGLAKPTAARVMGLAEGRQTLLTRAVFDLARRAAADRGLGDPEIRWLAHGPYAFHGLDETLEIFEIGFDGRAPLAAPQDTKKAKRVVALGDETTLGWRPAAGQTIPRRLNWTLGERLGEGGFGEVWSACHKTGERRIFKFCFDAARLRSLKREVTLFRHMRDALGHRDDIARILDWSFDEAPFFLEAEYTEGGNLAQWAARSGGLGEVPLDLRVELVAQVAEALQAAHSVGVLHKDVKPENVLVATGGEAPRARLADFGIGRLTDESRLLESGITGLGFTATLANDTSATGGTFRYLAPEVVEGKPATIQADVYALGVVLYQMAVGDFGRTLAPGWRRDLEDELLAEDIAVCVDGVPERRLASAGELAPRLRTLAERRARRAAERRRLQERERSRRRRRLATVAGVVASALLVVVSIFAYQTYRAKNREKLARVESEQRRRQAERLIDFMLGDLRQKLQPIGRLEILGEVGDQAMEYFAAVPQDTLSDEEMRHHSKALHQVGQVRFGLGRFPEAAEAFGESLTLAERLAARDPEDGDWQFELGQSHFWMGYLRWQQRDTGMALEQFEAYLAISEELVARDPENSKWQLELAFAHSNLASILEERGELAGATEELEASARILEDLVVRESADRKLPVELGQVYAKLGQVLKKRGDLAGSLARFQAYLDILQRAVAEEPDNFELARFLGFAHSHLGDLRRLRGDVDGTLESYRADLDISVRLSEHDPDNLIWKGELALRHGKVARAFLLEGRSESARFHLEQERAIVRDLIREAPEYRTWRFYRALDHWWWGDLSVQSGRFASALRELEACRFTLRSLVEEVEDGQYRLWLARACWLLGVVLGQLDDAAEARASLEEGAALAERLATELRTPEHLDVWVRSLLSLGRREQARPLIAELAAMGYRESSFLEFLTRQGWG